MIIPVSGKVKYPITLDASVWIFDDRRIKLEDAFKEGNKASYKEKKKTTFSSDERFNREVVQASNDNKPIPRKDADEILKSTYVIPFNDFYQNLEVEQEAKEACIVQSDEQEVIIPLDKLKDSYLLFSYKGKPLQDDGPIHIYYRDGSNKEDPIKAVKKIVIQ
jgi:adenine-specific DNA glycosylase